jgi:hypothetical protein
MPNAPYRRDIEPLCEYCRHGTEIGGGELACLKRGFSRVGEHCAKFRYDATKRVPEVREKPDASKFEREDFEL